MALFEYACWRLDGFELKVHYQTGCICSFSRALMLIGTELAFGALSATVCLWAKWSGRQMMDGAMIVLSSIVVGRHSDKSSL